MKHDRASRSGDDAPAAERRAGERRAAERRAGERRAAGGRAGDRPAVERRVRERRSGERRTGERRTGERRTGIGSIELRRVTGRRIGPLPPEVAFFDAEAARLYRAGERPSAGGGHGADPWAGVLLLGAIACSALLGYVVGEGAREPSGPIPSAAGLPLRTVAAATLPGMGAALGVAPDTDADGGRDPATADTVVASAAVPVDPLWVELGRVRAEILRLRVLFRRLADVAKLEDGEFDLDLEPLELPAVRRAADALDLSIRALDPISEQGSRMARIFDERRAAHDRRVGGRVAPGAIRTSGFGHRRSPFGGRRQLHRGVDFAGLPGTPIHALADGIVAYSGANGGYGNLVEIEHGDGYRTRYAHNQENLVAVGERVAKGDIVASLGSSGRSTGPHVHVEVRHDGAALDPASFIR